MAPDITSPANERIKWLVRLRDRRHRDAEGLFLVEGENLYRRALASGLTPDATFVSSDVSIDTVGTTLTVDPAVLDKASYRQTSQDLIAVFPQIPLSLSGLDVPGDTLVLVAENVEKPGNVGAMLRTAAAAGVGALVILGSGVDVHNPNVVRASMGALFEVRLARGAWDEFEKWREGRGIRLVGASPDASRSMWDADLTGSVGIVVGAEDEGLSGRARDLVDETVLIPQAAGPVDSLNVSVSAAILLYEARRQRGF